MFELSDWTLAAPVVGDAPALSVVIDTEEEFDWRNPVARRNTGVTHIRHLIEHNRIYEAFGLKPTYVVDYPVASTPEASAPMRELAASKLCEIGSHLHPWVNPPFAEEVNVRNSFPGNLPAALERQKLRQLGDAIRENLGVDPVVYRAGRLGVGPSTPHTLLALGYRVDTSVVPRTDFCAMQGPDFTGWAPAPCWYRDTELLEIPVTADWVGALSPYEPALRPIIASLAARQMKLQGLLARTHILERIRLTPEGMSFTDLRRLVRWLLAAGHRIFNLIYHSPSVVPGHTPYVRSEAERASFQSTIERFLNFFMGELGGRPVTLMGLWQEMAQSRVSSSELTGELTKLRRIRA